MGGVVTAGISDLIVILLVSCNIWFKCCLDGCFFLLLDVPDVY